MLRSTTFLCLTIVTAVQLRLAADGAVSQEVPIPGGTVAMARSLGITPAPERARFVAELARLIHQVPDAKRSPAAAIARRLTAHLDGAIGSNQGTEVQLDIPADRVPIPLTAEVWARAVFRRPVAADDLFVAIMSDPQAAHLCYGLAASDDDTLQFFVNHQALITHLYERDAAVFAAFGGSLHIHDNRVVPPGGTAAASVWEAVVGEELGHPERFVRALFERDDGRLAYLYDTIGQLDPPRAAFALGLWMKDSGARAERFKALAAVNRAAVRQWQPTRVPFSRPLYDVASLLARVQAAADGTPSFPLARSAWAWIFEGVDLPSAFSRVPNIGDASESIDAAWLAQTIVSADTRERGDRLDQLAFGQRAFASADVGTTADILVAIRAFPRCPMLMLTLERIGIRHASVYASAARRAQQLSSLDGRRGFVAFAEFQGALALIARMVSVQTIEIPAAERLVDSLSAIPLNREGRYAGAVATWIAHELRPAVVTVRITPDATSGFQRDQDQAQGMESVLLRALSGVHDPNGGATSLVSWEGQVYRFDPAASEERRLRRIREKQAGTSADLALDLAAIGKTLSDSAIALDDVLAAAAALKKLAPALAPARKNNEPDTLPPGVNAARNARDMIDRLTQDLSKITTAADLQKVARIAAPLDLVVDEVLADVLMAWTYAVSIGDPEGPVLLTGNVMRRHDFGFGTRERGLHSRTAWAVPKQEIAARVPWRVNGSLLGLDVALSSLALRRIGGDRVIDVPTLSSNEREAFAVAASLLNPFALHDADRDLIADRVARGRQRVASLAEDAGALEAIAAEIRLDGWRRRALQWTMVHEPQQVVRMFSMTELLYLGGGPAAALDAWGMSAIASSGCVCTRLAPPNEWRTLLGRPQVGLMAATVADLNLHVAVMLRELRLPSALAKSVLVAAVQDFIDEVRPTDANDWLTLVRTAQAVPRERIEDYVAAAAADGPLIPETVTETRQP